MRRSTCSSSGGSISAIGRLPSHGPTSVFSIQVAFSNVIGRQHVLLPLEPLVGDLAERHRLGGGLAGRLSLATRVDAGGHLGPRLGATCARQRQRDLRVGAERQRVAAALEDVVEAPEGGPARLDEQVQAVAVRQADGRGAGLCSPDLRIAEGHDRTRHTPPASHVAVANRAEGCSSGAVLRCPTATTSAMAGDKCRPPETDLRKFRRKSRCRGPLWMRLEETVVPVGGLEPPTLRL